MNQPDYGQVKDAFTGEVLRSASFMDLVDSLFGKERLFTDWKLKRTVKVEGENALAHEQACAYLSQGS